MHMQYFRFLPAAIFLAWGLCSAGAAAQETKPAPELKFAAKNGDVSFNHAAHIKREKGDCKACHDKVFQKSAKAPLEFKAGMHKPAETAKTSCGTCHHPDGPAFGAKGNCAKCHVKA